MSHYTAPLWVVDPSNVGKNDPTDPSLKIESSGLSLYEEGEVVFDITSSGISNYQNGIAVSSSKVTVPLTTAQITGMFASPVSLVPAPGDGKLILVTSFIYENIFNTTAFLNGGVVDLYYGNVNTKASGDLSAANTALQTSTSIIATGGISTVFNGATLQNIINRGLSISNATAPFDTGDGSARITIVYNILTV